MGSQRRQRAATQRGQDELILAPIVLLNKAKLAVVLQHCATVLSSWRGRCESPSWLRSRIVGKRGHG